jgi:hypothetical protein
MIGQVDKVDISRSMIGSRKYKRQLNGNFSNLKRWGSQAGCLSFLKQMNEMS